MHFPWNRWLKTSALVGGGLSYSAQIWRIDREKHPREHRSHVKFYWPVELTLALPSLPRHQLVLFSHHQSGGTIFDEGGFDTFGIGYRLVLPIGMGD